MRVPINISYTLLQKILDRWNFWLFWLTFLAWVGIGSQAQAQNSLNVTNFGAVGDCAQVWVNTVSNSVIVSFTNSLAWPASSNKTVELFGVGAINTYKGTNYNQDLIAVITNVVNGTNIYLSGDIPTLTLNGVYCVYGANNASAFQAAVDAAAGTNTIINIPAGNFLLIPPAMYTNFNNALPYPNYMAIYKDQGIFIKKGGLHFLGAGQNATILTGEGAFKNQGGYCLRGMIFNCNGPITNDYPLIWDSLTFDGGLELGLSGNQGIQPANYYNGVGWDGTSAAGLDSGSEPLNSFKEFVNCRFQHFRGEMIKGITGSARTETILVTNCVFWDGNATAFNYNFAHTITGCTFSNMYQIEEFYLKYPTNKPSYFNNNSATNVGHNFVSLNGGTATNMPYYISNNIFYQNGGNAIQTTPACNVTIVSNRFVGNPSGYNININLGAAGAQGWYNNSNILIIGNSFLNPSIILEISGDTYNRIGLSNPNGVQNVSMYGNVLTGKTGSMTALQVYDWCTNINIYDNDFQTQANPTPSSVYFSSGACGFQYVTVATNNLYCNKIGNFTSIPKTNVLNYGGGPRYQTTHNTQGDIFVLQDSDAVKIPAGAQMILDNSTNDGTGTYTVYLDSAMTRPMTVTSGQIFIASWINGDWVNTANIITGIAPTVSSIVANVSSLSPNSTIFQTAWGTAVQLSASASTTGGHNLTWQWSYSVNGGPQIVAQRGSGTTPISNFTYSTDTGGNTYIWTLHVTDTTTGLSTQSQFTVFVQLQPPQGILVIPN